MNSWFVTAYDELRQFFSLASVQGCEKFEFVKYLNCFEELIN